jgi:hypothetical protein
MPDDNRKPERSEADPVHLEQLLEIELMQKRAAWKQAKARHGAWRAFSYLFLLIVILAAAVGYFFFFSADRVPDLKSGAASAQPTASPVAP